MNSLNFIDTSLYVEGNSLTVFMNYSPLWVLFRPLYYLKFIDSLSVISIMRFMYSVWVTNCSNQCLQVIINLRWSHSQDLYGTTRGDSKSTVREF